MKEELKYILRTYKRLFWGFLLSLMCIGVGVRLAAVYPSAVLQGIVASFLVVTGIQIALWCLGIRTELFSTAPDPVDANELDYDAIIHMERLVQSAATSARMVDELRNKLAQAIQRADAPR